MYVKIDFIFNLTHQRAALVVLLMLCEMFQLSYIILFRLLIIFFHEWGESLSWQWSPSIQFVKEKSWKKQ